MLPLMCYNRHTTKIVCFVIAIKRKKDKNGDRRKVENTCLFLE